MQILLKAETDGPNWTDEEIAEAFSCRTRTVEKIRQRLVERGFDKILNGAERPYPPVQKLPIGAQVAHHRNPSGAAAEGLCALAAAVAVSQGRGTGDR